MRHGSERGWLLELQDVRGNQDEELSRGRREARCACRSVETFSAAATGCYYFFTTFTIRLDSPFALPSLAVPLSVDS